MKDGCIEQEERKVDRNGVSTDVKGHLQHSIVCLHLPLWPLSVAKSVDALRRSALQLQADRSRGWRQFDW